MIDYETATADEIIDLWWPFDDEVNQAEAIRELVALRDRLKGERDEYRNRCDQLRQQAAGHAQEARTQAAIVRDIYQVVTGGTGEPGDWHGAQPVRAAFYRLAESNAALVRSLEIASAVIDDCIMRYAPERCDAGRAAEVEERILQSGGTLAYLADTNSKIRAALAAAQPRPLTED